MSFGACKQSEAKHEKEEAQSIRINISGTVELPEWVDLDHEGEGTDKTKAFTLRHNEQGYPKIRLSGIEDGNQKFEAFPSSVWLYTPNWVIPNPISVEDYGGDPDRVTTQLSGTNKSSGSDANARGVSRIIKKGDTYHVLISYEVTGHQGKLFGPTDDPYPNNYRTLNNLRAFAALGHQYRTSNGRPDGSKHRIYMPKPHTTNTTTVLQLDPLKHIPEDFIVGEASSTRVHGQTFFKLPFFSNYANLSQVDSPTAAGTATRFHMAGVLLALKFDNRTGREIIIHKIHTRSNNLCYSGYYELWKEHRHSQAPRYNTLPTGATLAPFFARSDQHINDEVRHRAVYPIDIQDENGGTYRLQAQGEQAKTSGRFYLWGGIDLSRHAGQTTLLQVEYSYADTPNERVYAEAIDLAPKTAPNKFEEGKAYLITVPINKPRLNYPLLVPRDLIRVDAQDFPTTRPSA